MITRSAFKQLRKGRAPARLMPSKMHVQLLIKFILMLHQIISFSFRGPRLELEIPLSEIATKNSRIN